MSEENLLPCPFCGGEAELSYEYELGQGYCIKEYYVKCSSCGASGGDVSQYFHNGTEAELKKLAIEKWNMRADKLQANVEKILGALIAEAGWTV